MRVDDGFFEAAVRWSPTAMVATDTAGTIVFANERAAHVLGTEQLAGDRLAACFGDELRAASYLTGLAHSPAGAMFFTGETTAADASETRFLHVYGAHLPSGGGTQTLLFTLVDATQARRREAELEQRALYDELTGLANRALLVEQMRQLATGQADTGALLFIDLDGFKQVNDRLGHSTGDRLLVVVADRLRRVSPPGAMTARLGGDEFAILLESATQAAALEVAVACCAAVTAPITDLPATVTASIGVAPLTGVQDTLRQADLAMYAAKTAGRNRVVVYSQDLEQPSGARAAEPDPVAELRAERDRLHAEARTDALTGLGNRRGLDEYLDGYTGPLPVSVLFVDIDRFSAYNHRHGDTQGDRALRTVAQTLLRNCRGHDQVFRKGGEEFVVVLPGADEVSAAAAGERVRAAVEDLCLEHGGIDESPLVTVTVGAATDTTGDLNDALRAASDTAYQCKVAGRRNQVALNRPS
jgi:diguanylate cyclase (GGDEF)-like protein